MSKAIYYIVGGAVLMWIIVLSKAGIIGNKDQGMR
jgi:hypothetical protein